MKQLNESLPGHDCSRNCFAKNRSYKIPYISFVT